MTTLTSIIMANSSKRAVRIKAGNTEIYIGINCNGLEEMNPNVLKWFDTHKALHVWSGRNEVEVQYKGSAKLERMIFG